MIAMLIPGIFGVLLLLLLAPLGILIFAFWIWMLVDAIQNRGLSDGEKIAWVIAIIFTHFLGAMLYFFIGHPKRNAPPRIA